MIVYGRTRPRILLKCTVPSLGGVSPFRLGLNMYPTNGEPDVEGTDGAANSADNSAEQHQTTAAVSMANLRVPAFYRENAGTWFTQLEAQFALCKITSDASRHLYCLANLPEDVASAVSLDGSSYNALKSQILTVFGKSKIAYMEDALTLDVSETKPSVAAHRLRQAYVRAGMEASDDILKHRILRSLPLQLQTTLAAHQQESLERFLATADNIFDVTNRTTVGTNKVGTGSASSEPGGHRSRAQSPLGVRPFRSDQRPVVCRSHIYYGREAKTCRPWCQWPGPKPTTRSRTVSPAGGRAENA